LAILAALTVAFCDLALAEDGQPQDKFEAAIRNESSSPSVILLTVVDDRTGQARTGCAMAPFLLGALQRETGATTQKELEGIALANHAHLFHFKKQAALDNIPFVEFSRVCAAVRQGHSVLMRDRGGDFVDETTGEVLEWPPRPH
jgi:hypothetical protein